MTKEPVENAAEKQKQGMQLLEKYKFIFDYLKHLTTLSTSLIVLLGAFPEKFIAGPNGKFLFSVSLGGFLLTVLSSIVAYTLYLGHFRQTESFPDWEKQSGMFFVLLAFIGFAVGMVALSIRVIFNFLTVC